MTDVVLQSATALAIMASAMMAGLFLTFSDFVMRSLAFARPAAGMEAMQIINREIMKSLTIVVMLGMMPLSVGLAVYGWLAASGGVVVALTAGAVLYGVGVVGVSLGRNVPMNNLLEHLDARDHRGQSYWRDYVPGWTFWNWLRALSSACTCVCYLYAFSLLG